VALERVWIGSVMAGHETEHEELVTWLKSDAGARMLRQYRLKSYELRQSGSSLLITMHADDPPTLVHFLRNHAAWPDFWEFSSNALGDAPMDTQVRLTWRNDGA
jgi:hypothetical protein